MKKILLVTLLASSQAWAGGIGRPNPISARSIGMGGAFTAIADDPSALHFNPAGLVLQPSDGVLFGAELIMAPRTYTPITDAGGRGEDQSPHNVPIALPTLGYMTRFERDGVPSRLALGVGLWNTFGGQLTYDKLENRSTPALDHTQTAVLELVPGVAYEVNEFLQIGFAFRLGIGLFAVDATAKPADGTFSAFGVGAGATLGIMVRPSDSFQIGAAWRSALTTNLNGDGELALNPANPDDKTPVEVAHKQEWPQQASIGAAWRLGKVRLAAAADWTDWSRVDKIIIEFKGQPLLNQTYHVDFHDSFALHGGAEVEVNPRLHLRGGYTFDSNAVPDRTIERQYLDADKHCVALGGGYQLTSSWRFDTALEYLFGPVRVIEDNTEEMTAAGWPQRANVSPGEHSGTVLTFELQAQYRY